MNTLLCYAIATAGVATVLAIAWLSLRLIVHFLSLRVFEIVMFIAALSGFLCLVHTLATAICEVM